MIIEKQTFKLKSELQDTIKKLKINKSTIYYNADKKGFQEILSNLKSSQRISLILIES